MSTSPRQATNPSSKVDWEKLGFVEKECNGYVSVTWKDGKWGEPNWNKGMTMNISIASPALNYGQQCFEGIKAFRTAKNSVHIFRPQENSLRLNLSARMASMPEVPTELFLQCLLQAVSGNLEFVPPYAPKASAGALYIRPLLLGSGPRLILDGPDEYTFIVWVTAVGSLYGSSDRVPAVDAFVLDDFDRTAPKGTGHTKLGGNYAPVFKPMREKKKMGYPITLHLDSQKREFIDEFSTSNALALKKDGDKFELVVPESTSILRSVTKVSVCEIAKHILDWKVDLRPVSFSEVKSGVFQEFFAAGTAAGITAVRSISYNTHEPVLASGGSTSQPRDGPVWESPKDNKVEKISFGDGVNAGQGAKTLLEELTSYQCGDRPDKFGWLWPQEGIVAEDFKWK